MLADCLPWLQVYRGLLRGVQVVAVKVFNDGPQYTSDSSQERLQTLQVLKQQRETLIRQEIAVLKSCRPQHCAVRWCMHPGRTPHMLLCRMPSIAYQEKHHGGLYYRHHHHYYCCCYYYCYY